MKLTHIRVENYKGLRELECPISDFFCAIGENNAGKSSLLQALLLFVNGTRLNRPDFYDPYADILITVTLSHVTEDTLSSLADEQRGKLQPFVSDETLVLARRYSTDGSSKLRVVTAVPRETKYRADQVDNVFKGKNGKENGETLLTFYPETVTAEQAQTITTQKAAKETIEAFVDALPEGELVDEDVPLPTGIDNSVRSLLPEPVYIPAVKDLTDDLKTKESASFGKLLNILLDVIEGDLTDAVETFENLRKKLNRVTQTDGTVVDERMGKVQEIEQTIESNLRETFRNVSIELEIPPPEIKTVLSNANIVADDGVRGPIDNKGDGFKRAITFSILRSYVQLSQDDAWREQRDTTIPGKEKFVFLFEEPELYLHPNAQKILFDALALISERHQVLVTTHSPLFFSADETKTFAKITKNRDKELPKPVAECSVIDLTDVTEKDRFQLISFDTNNLAFFSDRIVLVEGDSELIALPHIAQLLKESWDFKSGGTSLVKISGKGSFLRYRNFFDRFETEVAILADLDAIVDGFDKLKPSERAYELRGEILSEIDRIIDQENGLPEPNPRFIKDELQRERAQRIYRKIKEARANRDAESVERLLDELFVFERTRPRLEVLKEPPTDGLVQRKRELLEELRKGYVYILEKGEIEAYYPDSVTGADKPTKAQHFCATVTSAESARALCGRALVGGKYMSEFEVIFGGIFDG